MLAQMGVMPDDLVAIALSNGVEFHETTFAVWKLGATPSPLSPRLPDSELRAILAVMQPRIVVGICAERAPGYRIVPAGTNPDPGLANGALEPRTARYQKAITSGGSTGTPKVIVDHTPASLDPNAIGLGMTLDGTIILPGPLYHNGPFGISHRSLCRGGHVIEVAKFDPEETLALIERYRVGWAMLVPTMMRRIWALPPEIRGRYDLSSLEMVVHMAAPCPAWLKHAWTEWLGPDRIWEVYAGTERMGAVCIGGRDWLMHPGSVGKPAPGRVSVLDATGRSCTPGEVGEIRFHPAPEASGPSYHYLGAVSKAYDRSDSYGDLGHFDVDGFPYIDDRRTDMIVSGGANIYPAEVEGMLEQHPEVLASAVIGIADEDLGQRLHAIVEPRDSGSPPPSRISSATSPGYSPAPSYHVRSSSSPDRSRTTRERFVEGSFVKSGLR
jgi:bile acid-coenzyme A ligase